MNIKMKVKILDLVSIVPENVTLERTKREMGRKIEIDSGERQEALQLFLN